MGSWKTHVKTDLGGEVPSPNALKNDVNVIFAISAKSPCRGLVIRLQPIGLLHSYPTKCPPPTLWRKRIRLTNPFHAFSMNRSGCKHRTPGVGRIHGPGRIVSTHWRNRNATATTDSNVSYGAENAGIVVPLWETTFPAFSAKSVCSCRGVAVGVLGVWPKKVKNRNCNYRNCNYRLCCI